jgi:hypothetical protein
MIISVMMCHLPSCLVKVAATPGSRRRSAYDHARDRAELTIPPVPDQEGSVL